MASFSMNCQVCGAEIVPRSYYDWDFHDRKQKTYYCPGDSRHVSIEMILPQTEVNYYLLQLAVQDKWYMIESRSHSIIQNSDYPVTILHSLDHYHGEIGTYETKRMLKIPRYYSIDLSVSIKEQVEHIYQELRKLLVFS